MKKVLIIDGQGGLLGKQMVEAVRKLIPEAEITAVGTNPMATTSMLSHKWSHGRKRSHSRREKCRYNSRAYRHRDSGFSSGRDHAGYGGGCRPEQSKKGLDSC